MSHEMHHDLISRVAARHILAAFSMDALARLSFLEGIAGVTPGSWLRKKARGFESAENWVAEQGGHLHPNWTTNRNTGMYDAVAKAVASVLRSVSGIDPEDIAQEIISESMLPGGRANRRAFYSAGTAIAKDRGKMAKLLGGELTPRSVQGIPANGAKRLALNEKKRLRERMEGGAPDSTVETRDDFFSQQPTISVDDPNVRQNVLLMAINSPASFPGAEKIRAVIDTTIERVFARNEKKAALMKEFFRELSKGKTKYLVPSADQRSKLKEDPKYFYRAVMRAVSSQAAKNLGIKPGRATTETFGSGGKNVEEFVEKHLTNNPAINKIVDNILDSLEFSTDWAHGARLAKKEGDYGDEDVIELFYQMPKGRPDLPEEQTPVEAWYPQMREEPQSNIAELLGLEPNEYMNYDLELEGDVMGMPRSHMAAKMEPLMDRKFAESMQKRVQKIVEELAEATITELGPVSRLADSAAKHLQQAHRSLTLLKRNL